MERPCVNPAILLLPVEDGYVAYDPASDRLHQLNPIAALIAELCDGTRTVEEIRTVVAPLLPEGKADEVDRWIDDGIKANLLTSSPSHGATRQDLSADDLANLAARLRDTGNLQTAFLCQKKAAELAVRDPQKWSFLGTLAHIIGRREEVRNAYERYLELEPNDPEIQHRMVALKDAPPPPRVPDECIRHLYKRFSSFYDSQLCERLHYRAPERIQESVESVFAGRDRMTVLDLGCGTGLAGVRFRPKASHLVGVDLSPEMIALAQERKLYDRLEVAEITDWLSRNHDRFDLILACECLVYFGDLRGVVAAAAKLLSPDGAFALTVERGERYPFHLADSGRFTHHPDHVREAANAAGLSVAILDQSCLRREYGVEVTGLFAVLLRAG